MTILDYDAELQAHNERLRAAVDISAGDHVLDIGCGAGQSAREAARRAAPGAVLGIDLSAPMIERARELTAAERIDNVTYEQGDAEVHPFARGHYDVAISRFGTMFFADPVKAFVNIAEALRPDGQLVLLVWQHRERNEWATALDAAIGGGPGAVTGGPFSLGDPAATTQTLERGGFGDISIADVREPVFYGHSVEAALAFVRGFWTIQEALARQDPVDAGHTLDRLRDTLAAHHAGADGVTFDSRAWIITARRG